MCGVKKTRILELLGKAGRNAFRTREFAAFVGNEAYARVVLHRLHKKKQLVPAKRGWWAFPNALPEEVACEISKPCYVSFHSALYLHGLTTQIPRIVQLAVARNAKTYSVLGVRVKEYKIKKEFFNGFYAKESLLVASAEKAFADCLNAPRSCPKIILKETLGGIDLDLAKKFISKPGLKRLEELIENA